MYKGIIKCKMTCCHYVLRCSWMFEFIWFPTLPNNKDVSITRAVPESGWTILNFEIQIEVEIYSALRWLHFCQWFNWNCLKQKTCVYNVLQYGHSTGLNAVKTISHLGRSLDFNRPFWPEISLRIGHFQFISANGRWLTPIWNTDISWLNFILSLFNE